MGDTVGTTQDGVVAQLKSTAGRILGTKHFSDRTAGQRPVRALPGIELFHMEATLIRIHAEHGQLAHLGIDVIVDPLGPDRPVAGEFVASPFQIGHKLLLALLGEDAVEHHAHAVALGHPQRVVVAVVEGPEVHVEFKLWQRRGHELAVTAQDVATGGSHKHAVAFLPFGHRHPEVVSHGHDIECLRYDSHTRQRENPGIDAVAGNDFLVVELIHRVLR